jgi:hypothetical protein
MSVRLKDGRWVVELYDPATRKKHQLNRREIRDLGFEPPANERQAKRVERAGLDARDRRRPGAGDETCGSFATRWPDDFTRRRGRSTREHNRERVRRFGREYADRPLRSITRQEALAWVGDHPATLAALRAMFTDAVNVRLADDNPFAKLGLEQAKGRESITVLTREESSSSPRSRRGPRRGVGARACRADPLGRLHLRPAGRGVRGPLQPARRRRLLPPRQFNSGSARRPRRSTMASARSTCPSPRSAPCSPSRAGSATT